MAKRFGRNQRRKMRNQIAARDAIIEALKQTLAEQVERTAKARAELTALEASMVDWADRIVALLGPDSAFAREFGDKLMDGDTFDALVSARLPLRADCRPAFTPFRLMEPRMVQMAEDLIDLFATYVRAERDNILMRRAFFIESPSGSRALMADERTLQTLRARGSGPLTRYLIDGLIAPWLKEVH